MYFAKLEKSCTTAFGSVTFIVPVNVFVPPIFCVVVVSTNPLPYPLIALVGIAPLLNTGLVENVYVPVIVGLDVVVRNPNPYPLIALVGIVPVLILVPSMIGGLVNVLIPPIFWSDMTFTYDPASAESGIDDADMFAPLITGAVVNVLEPEIDCVPVVVTNPAATAVVGMVPALIFAPLMIGALPDISIVIVAVAMIPAVPTVIALKVPRPTLDSEKLVACIDPPPEQSNTKDVVVPLLKFILPSF